MRPVSLRSLVFWPHLAAGFLAGAVILVMSVTGVLLTYEKQMIAWADGRVALAPRELLFTEADRADAVWVVLEGDVVVSKVADGDEVILDHLHPGGWLGDRFGPRRALTGCRST